MELQFIKVDIRGQQEEPECLPAASFTWEWLVRDSGPGTAQYNAEMP